MLFGIAGLPVRREPMPADAALDLFHPDDHERLRAASNRAQAEGRADVEARLVRPAGDIRRVLIRMMVVRDDAGHPARMVGIVVDLTRMLDLADSRDMSDARFRALAQATGQIIWIGDAAGLAIDISSNWETITGHSRDVIFSRHVYDLMHPDDEEWVRRRRTEAALAGQPFEGEFRLRHALGHYIVLRARSVAIRDAGGALTGRIGTFTDVTSIRESERRKAASDKRFADTFHTSRLPMLIRRVEDFRLLDINDAMLSLKKCRREDVIGSHIEDPPWNVDEDQVRDFVRTFLTEGRVRQRESFVFTGDGRKIPVLLWAEPIDVAGERCALISFEDISDKLAAEAGRRASEELFYHAFHASPMPQAIREDGTFRLTEVNEAWERLTGFSRDEVIGLTLDEMPTRPSDNWVERALVMFRTEGRVRQCEGVFRTKSGDMRAVLVSADPVVVGGRPHVLITQEDITARKRADVRLRALVAGTAGVVGADFFRSLVEQLSTALEVNCAFAAEIIGPERNRLRTLAVWSDDAVGPVFETPVAGTCSGLVLQSGRRLFEDNVRSLFPDDGLLKALGAVAFAGVPLLDSTGNPLGVLAVIHDRPLPRDEEMLSVLAVFGARAAVELERIRAEARLQHSQKIEAVGQLAGGIAHDFNNLLTVINGYCDRLGASLGPDHPLRHDLDLVQRAGQRAASLTRQLLAFSRRQVLQPQVLNLNSAVHDMEVMLGRLLGEHITVVTSLAPDLGAVRADPGQIEQVIMNLSINARDAMADGGTLAIETQNVEVGADDESRAGVRSGSYVALVIRDTGVGMSDSTLAHVFEPFYTTKESGKGTGLGLATVYGIVTQSGGNVLIESAVGRGTTVHVLLPRTDAPAVELRGTAAKPRAAAARETVLLVEDEELVRELVHDFLASAGYEVLEAQDAEQALAIAASSGAAIDAVVTDVVLPGMNGSDLAAKLRELSPRIRVLYVSGYPGTGVFGDHTFGPGSDFLSKPFTRQMLTQKLRDMLDATL